MYQWTAVYLDPETSNNFLRVDETYPLSDEQIAQKEELEEEPQQNSDPIIARFLPLKRLRANKMLF
jgi:hypothetical protein